MKIGMFDSGIGGLNVLPLAQREIKNAEFLYYGDFDNVPYGEKTPAEIRELSKKAAEFLVSKGALAIVIACNTATSASVAALREIYENKENHIPVIGMEPALKKAIDDGAKKRVLIAATPATVKGRKLSELIEKFDKDKKADLIPMPKLVSFAENLDFDSDRVISYIESEFSKLNMEEYSTFVLGCTHFNYFKNAFRRFLPKDAQIIDGVFGTVKRLKERLQKECNYKDLCKEGNPQVKYYISGREADSSENEKLSKLLHRAELMEKII